MSDWGKYLKNAVANVEQQLDKVLLDQKEERSAVPVQSRRTRPDLAERLKQAASGRPAPKEEHGGGEDGKDGLSDKNGGTGRTGGAAGSDKGAGGTTADAQPNTDRANTTSNTDSNAGSNADANADANADQTKTDNAKPGAQAESPADNAHETPTAEPTQPTQPKAEPKAEAPELVVVDAFEIAPDLGPVLNDAKKIALTLQRDDTRQLVALLESAQSELSTYIESMSTRLQSLHSKLKVISADVAQTETGQQRQVALLMEEGQRLSQQELKLGLLLKKLRTERSSAQARADAATHQLSAREAEVANLKAELEQKGSTVRELEAMVEHFRITAETANRFMENSTQLNASVSGDTHELSVLLEEKFAVERAKWHLVEADLLARIAELEQAGDSRMANFARLQQSLAEAQKTSLESREQVVELQDQLDSATEQYSLQESKLRAEINELQVAEAALKDQLAQAQQAQLQGQSQSLALSHPYAYQPELNHKGQLENPMGEYVYDSEPHHAGQYAYDQEMPGHALEQYAYEAEMPDHAVVGPSGPFGEYAEDFDPHHQPQTPPRDTASPTGIDDSPGAVDHTGISQLSSQLDDASSFLRSRRESSVVGQEHGSNLNLVKRLTLQVRKLENELSVTAKAAEFARQQRDEAQTEVARLVDTQDRLQQTEESNSRLEIANTQLQTQIGRLEAAAGDRDERIGELEADVRDLKDMYREQVEALVSEIEHLKSM